MADPRRFELDELANRPGTYFNPQTEIVVVVDDSPDVDSEIFNLEEFEGADWVLIADDTPIDEARRDELIERFQMDHHTVEELGEEDESLGEEDDDEYEDHGRD